MATQSLVQSGSRLHHAETVSNGATSEPVLILNPGDNLLAIEQVVVAVICDTANTIQFTLDPVTTVVSGSPDWIAWEPGEVTATKSATLPKQVTAVRCVNGGANSSKFKVVC